MRILSIYKIIPCFIVVVLSINQTQAASKKSKSKSDNVSSDEIEGFSQDGIVTDNSSRVGDVSEEATGLSREDLLRRIEVENALYRAQLEQNLAKEFAEARLEIERLKLERERIALKYEIENEESRKKHLEEVRALKDQKETLQAEVELTQMKAAKNAELFNSENLVYQQALIKTRAEVDLIKSTLDQRAIKEELKKYADLNISDFYFDQPLQKDGSLVVSDRRIDLNGVITPWKANYVVDSIQYFNNKGSRYPIFIIIENSPGGCVLSGSRILEAMHKSKAPVYVVLKGFAASMTAIIVTLAKKSFAYPNAEILHHQPSSSTRTFLNVREAKEFSREIEKCHQRFLGPVAKKMKISLDELDKKFYEHSINGDWIEYADDAKKNHWVDEIVSDIKEVSISKMPDPNNYTWKNYLEEYYSTGILASTTDNIMLLPQLEGNSFYWIYNPDNRFKVNCK